jgi:hypothetical protein
MIGAQDLKDARFFQGPHELRTGKLAAKFGSHPNRRNTLANTRVFTLGPLNP